jgi:hypothetical protein
LCSTHPGGGPASDALPLTAAASRVSERPVWNRVPITLGDDQGVMGGTNTMKVLAV